MTSPRTTGVTRAKLSRNNPQITPSKVPTSYDACVRNVAIYLAWMLIADMQHVHCLRTQLHDYFPETAECRMKWSIVGMLQIEMWRATCLFLMRGSQVGWVSELLVENRNTHTLLEDCTSDILFRWLVNALLRNPMESIIVSGLV